MGALLGALGTAGCSDETGLGAVSAVIQGDLVVDFGAVPVGITKKRSFKVGNDGTGVLTVTAVEPGADFSTARYAFKVPTGGFSVGSRSETSLELSFQPFALSGEEEFQSTFVIQSSSKDPQGNAISRTVTVKGRGIAAAIEVTPNPVDFGAVLAGASRTLNVRITNLLTDPIQLTSESNGQGAVVVRQSAGDGRFVIETPLTRNGSLIADDGTLAAGASIEVPVRYEPNPIPSMTSDDARWVISTCPDALCDVTVRLIGRSTDNAVECTPAALDFGAVNPNTTLTRQVTCRNVASDPVDVGPWALDATSDRAFTMERYTTTSSLAPGASYTVDVSFTPTDAMLQSGAIARGIAVFSALGSTGLPLMPIRVVLSGRAGGPTIVVTPEELHFGGIAIGTSRSRNVVVTNDGYEDLILSGIVEGPAATGDFSGGPTPLVIPSGTATVVRATFTPTTEGAIVSSLVFQSNDPITPELAVPADGVGVRLPPCLYTLTPAQLSMGLVYVGRTATAAATLTNVGTDLCLINDIELVSATATSGFTLPGGPETGIMLAPGDSKVITVSFTPRATGAHEAAVSFYISDPAQPEVLLPVTGVGGAVTEVFCPPNQTVVAGNPVVLSAMGMVIGRGIQGYQWTLVSAPVGGTNTPNMWNPTPPNTATVDFLPYIVGTYVVQATVFDDQGGSATCQTTVTAEGRGLRVTMTWDGNGDVDLHLHRPLTTTPWFGNANGDDAYYSNRTPVWDPMSPPSFGANPELDFDNTAGLGPENTTVEVPILNVDYTIGVHNFSGANGRIVTIQVFCGQGVVPTATFTSNPLQGNATGQCADNDFWTVAAVSFQSLGACTVTPINTYRTSAQACMAF